MRSLHSLIFVILVGLFTGCSTTVKTVEIDQNSIKVVEIKRHPFLIDHCKKLVIQNNLGTVISETDMYCDPGTGCNAYLFDSDSVFTVIECNGQWYNIHKRTGQISKGAWEWQKKIPSNYLGTFRRSNAPSEYNVVKEREPEISEVYKYKDPGE